MAIIFQGDLYTLNSLDAGCLSGFEIRTAPLEAIMVSSGWGRHQKPAALL